MEAATFETVVDNALGLMRPFITVIIGLALVYFLWGVVQFISASGDSKKVEDGKKTMVWGIIALFIMISVQGLVYLVVNSLELKTDKIEDKYKTYIKP